MHISKTIASNCLDRRALIIGGTFFFSHLADALSMAHASKTKASSMLETARIELHGNWGSMIPDAAVSVIDHMKHACLDGTSLVSDGQPKKIRVELRTSGFPSIWLHQQPDEVAWIIVNIGQQDWSKLAYQFGHELGHVVANSWKQGAMPARPCQWLEEAIVEAFSLRGLARLADEWSRKPLFAGDSGFGASLAVYRQNIIESYGKLVSTHINSDNFGIWFKNSRSKIENEVGLNECAKIASLVLLVEYENNPLCIDSICAINRWPGRTSLPLQEYIKKWEESCKSLNISPALPIRLREILDII